MASVELVSDVLNSVDDTWLDVPDVELALLSWLPLLSEEVSVELTSELELLESASNVGLEVAKVGLALLPKLEVDCGRLLLDMLET